MPTSTGLSAVPATPAALSQARALLVPPDSLPVALLEGQPERWTQLALLRRARASGLPILAWGNGAALLGRSAGGQVAQRRVAGPWHWQAEPLWAAGTLHLEGEVCLSAREMQVLASVDGCPALWQLGQQGLGQQSLGQQDLGLIDPQPSAAHLALLLERLPEPLRLSATPLEAIGGPEPLRLVLHDFYAQCRLDPLLAPTFAQVHDWPSHLARVQRFWETMLGEGGTQPWRGNLNHIHAPLRVSGAQLDRWLELFGASARRHLDAVGAELLVARATAMRERLGRG